MKRMPMKPELARATREGRKLETRRLMNPQPQDQTWSAIPMPVGGVWRWQRAAKKHLHVESLGDPFKPTYCVCEIVGIVEPWRAPRECDGLSGLEMVEAGYGIKDVQFLGDTYKVPFTGRNRMARFLPDAFVRTKVRIIGVEAQRVQQITEADAQREGVVWQCDPPCDDCRKRTARAAFIAVWDDLHPDFPFNENPWVWRYRYELVP